MRMEIIQLQVLMTMSIFLIIKIKDKKERTGFLVEIAKFLLREKSQDKEEKEKVILLKQLICFRFIENQHIIVIMVAKKNEKRSLKKKD